ncbi:hypothetical protein GGS23DRAFT_599621 [Durotheca rogersii]|uniref:uncharacterized protein n=1 Tax=Durotheca rogersii TaxID=419775 RepID=UPI002220E974|nr:uncharacterized protein GGS23DRAFT_599621 [Durotheca rogersii]KAI5860250.1 hypothetical protein GGS23DRAFT_599621 [Durotheca rogersii]
MDASTSSSSGFSTAASSAHPQQAATVAPPPPPAQKTPSTDVFIRDLNLVAEAAKRAQGIAIS